MTFRTTGNIETTAAPVWSVALSRLADTATRSRALALNAACDLIRQRHTVQRIEGRNGVIIGRKAVEQYCQDRTRPP
jgi:hypothetical protein